MSTREYAKTLIDQIPESKLIFVVPYLQGAALPDDVETPNAKTLAAIEEVENMIETGSGTVFERTRGIRGENRRGRMRIISIRKDRCNMSTRELARTLLDEMPDNDLIYLVAYMQSLKALKDAEIPNAKTQAAIDEVDSMIRTGEGEHFEGSTADFFAQLAAEG